jgi:hypothetical protein
MRFLFSCLLVLLLLLFIASSKADEKRPAPLRPATLSDRRHLREQQRWMLEEGDSRRAARQQHYGGWTPHESHRETLEAMRAAQTPEALERATSLRGADLARQDAALASYGSEALHHEEFARVVGLMDSSEMHEVFEHLMNCMDESRYELLPHLLTDDAVVIDHSSDYRCKRPEDCLRVLADARTKRCAMVQCDRASFVTDTLVSGDGPVAVFRVTELLHTLENTVQQRTLHVFFVTFRAPLDLSAPLSHSKIAVIEHLQTSLASDYEAPLELVNQARSLQDYSQRYTAHWRRLHDEHVREQHDTHLRRLYRGDTRRNADDAEELKAWCRRRTQLNEPTGQIDCRKHAPDV